MSKTASLCSMDKITENDLIAAKKVKKLWLDYKQKHKIGQEKAAQQVGMSQGSFSQYINGGVPINMAVLARFSGFFGVPPWEIREELRNTELEDKNKELVEEVESYREVLLMTEDYLKTMGGDSYILNRVKSVLSRPSAEDAPRQLSETFDSEQAVEDAAKKESLRLTEDRNTQDNNSALSIGGRKAHA